MEISTFKERKERVGKVPEEHHESTKQQSQEKDCSERCFQGGGLRLINRTERDV